jgi:hypothetical protein
MAKTSGGVKVPVQQTAGKPTASEGIHSTRAIRWPYMMVVGELAALAIVRAP